ncbi:MAG: hypothetical protein HS113_26365 [Verrucomicrobiales bacterium]|nr:hypothetical protein [Verrucomicrobiales bacterium]
MIRRSRRFKRRIGYAVGLVTLLLLSYFVLSNSWFLKTFVLPRVAAATGTQLSVAHISLQPFSRLQLKQVRVETTGEQPLLRADEITVRYHLLRLLRGQVAVPEISLVRPELHVVVTADGKSNLDPWLTGETSPQKPGEEPLIIDLGAFTIRSGALTYCQWASDGSRQCSSLTNLNVDLTNLRSGAKEAPAEPAKANLKLSAAVLQTMAAAGGPPESAQGNLTGALEFSLLPSLLPGEARGDVRLDFTTADGALSDLAGWSGLIDLDLTKDELRRLSLKFLRQNQELGEARLFGPFSLSQKVGRLNFRLSSIGHTALNLLGAPLGLNFGETAIDGSGFCDVAAGGRTYTANLALSAQRFSVRQGTLATPPLELAFELRGNADLSESRAHIERLSLSGKHQDRDFLSISAQNALNLNWAKIDTRSAAPAPTIIGLTVKDLRLSDWRALVSTNVNDGLVNLHANIVSADNGRRLTADLSNVVERLELTIGDTLWKDLGAVFTGRLTLSDYRNVRFEAGQFNYLEGNAELLRSRISASYDLTSNAGNIEIASSGDLPILLSRHPVPELHFDQGTLGTSLLLNWGQDRYSGSVTLQIGNAEGTVGGYRVDGYSAQFDANGDLHRDKFAIRRLGLSAREGTRNGGTIELVGQLDGATQTAQLNLNVSDLNQAGLRPFLAPTWTTHDLTSATIKATGELRYDAGAMPPISLDDTARLQRLVDQLATGIGTTTLHLNAEATNLVVQSRANGQSSPPFGFALLLAGSRQGELFKLNTNRIQLPPTASPTFRAQNELLLSGQFDLAPVNPTPSTLTVRAESLDLTTFSDLVTVLTTTPTNTTATAAAATPAPEVEPPALSLPLRQLDASLDVAALYLREIEVRNWKAKAQLRDDRLTIAPFGLQLNGGDVTATAALDLTRPGYTYQFTATANQVPLAPLVNSSAPDYRDSVQGQFLGQLAIGGAGITGPSLQQHLNGTAQVSSTNLSFQIVTPRTKKLLTTLATALRLQDLAQSPLTLLAANVLITNGAVNVRPFTAASDAFFATSEGVIRLDPVLTNSSVQLPIQLALREDLARQIKLVNLTPSSRTNYLALPPLVRLAGTLGAPETEIDKVRLAALLAGSVGGALGGQTGTALQGVGSLLQGDAKEAIGSLNTLIPGQRPAALSNVLSLTNLLSPAKAPTNAPTPPSTNAPATNAAPATPPTNTTSQPTLRNVLDALRKRD